MGGKEHTWWGIPLRLNTLPRVLRNVVFGGGEAPPPRTRLWGLALDPAC